MAVSPTGMGGAGCAWTSAFAWIKVMCQGWREPARRDHTCVTAEEVRTAFGVPSSLVLRRRGIPGALESGRSLCSCGLVNDSTLELGVPLRGGMMIKVRAPGRVSWQCPTW